MRTFRTGQYQPRQSPSLDQESVPLHQNTWPVQQQNTQQGQGQAHYDATKRPYSGTGRLTAPKQQRINHLAYGEDLADTKKYRDALCHARSLKYIVICYLK